MLPFNPHPDSNSSSLAYLDNLPPGTNPYVTPDPALMPAQPPQAPRVQNTPKPEPVLSQGQDDAMDIDTGNDRVARSGPHASPEDNPGHGKKRTRSEANKDEVLEHSEPQAKRRRASSPDPATTESVATPAQPVPLDPKEIAKEAAAAGKLDELKRLINEDENIQANFRDWNLGHVAAKHGHTNILEWLAEQGENLERFNDKGYTAMQVAARFGKLGVIQCLAKHRCDIEQQTDKERTLVHLAAKGGHLEVIKWLALNECEIDDADYMGRSAFILAARGGHLEVLKWLYEQGCDIDETDNYLNPVISNAVECGQADVVEWLLQQGCSLEVQDKHPCQPESPIWWAVANQHIDILKLFISHGIKITDVLDHEGNSLLFVAINQASPDIVAFLAPYYDMSARSASGQTPIMCAAQGGLISICIPLILLTLNGPS